MPLEPALDLLSQQVAVNADFLEVDAIVLELGGRSVLQGTHLHAMRGELVRLIGPPGAGKSVLLRVIAGLQKPDQGSVRIAQVNPYGLKPNAAAGLRRMLGIVLQDPLLIADASVIANVALPAHAAGVTARDASERAQRILQRLGIDAKALGDRAVNTLPRSVQQLTALARALVNRPALLLLDEPTAHLGPEAAVTFTRALQQFARSGVSVVVATQGHFMLPAARDVRIDVGRTA